MPSRSASPDAAEDADLLADEQPRARRPAAAARAASCQASPAQRAPRHWRSRTAARWRRPPRDAAPCSSRCSGEACIVRRAGRGRDRDRQRGEHAGDRRVHARQQHADTTAARSRSDRRRSDAHPASARQSHRAANTAAAATSAHQIDPGRYSPAAMIATAPISSTIATVVRNSLSAGGARLPSSASTPIAKAMSVAAGIAQPALQRRRRRG